VYLATSPRKPPRRRPVRDTPPRLTHRKTLEALEAFVASSARRGVYSGISICVNRIITLLAQSPSGAADENITSQ
jgi:hypothetical protein